MKDSNYVNSRIKEDLWGGPRGSDNSDFKESTCNAGDLGSIPGLIFRGRFPQRRDWLPTQVFLPGEVRGQRSLAGYSP